MAKNESTSLTTQAEAGLPAEMLDELIQDAGAGTSQSADDNIVPFIALLQDMSPEVKKRDPEYVEGAEVGFFLNKATKPAAPALPALRIRPLHRRVGAAQRGWRLCRSPRDRGHPGADHAAPGRASGG